MGTLCVPVALVLAAAIILPFSADSVQAPPMPGTAQCAGVVYKTDLSGVG